MKNRFLTYINISQHHSYYQRKISVAEREVMTLLATFFEMGRFYRKLN